MSNPQATFRALADPTRRQILATLVQGERTITEVAQLFDMTRPAVKKHLTVLADGNLIRVIPKGRERINQINPEGLSPVLDWFALFDVFWDDRLQALKSALEKDLQ